MAEEKKDAFTFSDKIKNSKPAFNPFSKRASSKIGTNGKPQKTLFERTRRDAPFFIAALAALLMLPFLYKYSGTVSDGGALVAPGMSDTVFDPERFDFEPSTEDSFGQISQLTGRDPLSLIKGWGSSSEESARYDYGEEGRDGFGAFSANDKNTKHSTSISTYRRKAPAAARAAFKRTPTKVNPLGRATLNSRAGGGVGTRFGGGLKAAAKKNSSAPLRQPTKPVSLQPLRAAGSPSRSYFGQDGVAQARASRDAMSKGNAAQALKDAVFEPVKNGRVGGLTDGLFAQPGGAGKLERNMDFKPQTPWWWDMMQQREQEKWKWRYNLLRKPFADLVAKVIAGQIGCCLATGDKKCEAGKFFGTKAESAKEPVCKISGGKTYSLTAFCQAMAAGKWSNIEEKYKNVINQACDENATDDERSSAYEQICTPITSKDGPETSMLGVKVEDWEEGHGEIAAAGPIKTRLNCMGGLHGRGKGSATVKEAVDCAKVKDGLFMLQKGGKALNWKYSYIVVLAENTKNDEGKYLCDASKRGGASVSSKGEGTSLHEHYGYKHDTKGNFSSNEPSVDDEALCVVYVGTGDVFDKSDYQEKMDQIEGGFDIKPVKIVGYVMKQRMGDALNTSWNDSLPILGNMPMSFADFERNYIRGRFMIKGKSYVSTECPWTVEDTPPNGGGNPPGDGGTPICKKGDEERADGGTEKCPFVKRCEQKEDGSWGWGEPEKKDPNCVDQEDQPDQKVVTIEWIKNVPGFEGCNEQISNRRLLFVSKDITTLLRDAEEKYNQEHKAQNEILDYGKDCISIAELLHAMSVVGGEVPVNAVCMLGKSIGNNSQDPHVIQTPDNTYDNMFGAFAAYMGERSAYYPRRTIRNSNARDPRFYWCSGVEGAGVPREVKTLQKGQAGAKYHYGYYVLKSSNNGPSQGFKDALESGPWKGAPLEAIANAVGWNYNSGMSIDENRKAYDAKYDKIFFGENSCGLTGTMSYAKVKEYINAWCSNQNAKPDNGKQSCGHTQGYGTGSTVGGELGTGTKPCDPKTDPNCK